LKQTFINFLGILWTLLFSSLTFIAILLHSGYNPLIDFMSVLGAGEGAGYFNAGMIIAGIIGSILVYERYKNDKKILMIVGIFSMISLTLIGVFPMGTWLHVLFTGVMLGSMGLFFITYGIIRKNYYTIAALVAFILFSFINISLSEWIVFVTVNVWMLLTSARSYYQKTKSYKQVQNI